ncbi:MAG: hypothetical protein ABSF37_02190 [Sedimentisphaerales bacterium]|jgi:hypothetical protein
MRQTELWELDYGIADVAYRVGNGGYKPLAAGGFGRREGGFQIYRSFPSFGGFLWNQSFILQDTTSAEASLGKLNL